MLTISRTRLQLLAGIAALALPALAHAAPGIDVAPKDEVTDVTATTAADPADQPVDGGQGLTDVVVTATRREKNMQKTPVAISVLGTQAIQDPHVQSLYDLADGGMPSLRVATFEARQSALAVGIRGIVPLDANQPAREQGVGIYLAAI